MLFKAQNISDIDPEGITLTPTIVEVGVKPMVIYYVYFEKENIGNDGEATFLDALKVAYALYFILNIKYPKISQQRRNFCKGCS
ncbi:hypothetical protein JTB14_007259 [Gonioctena quinquepunctata]|nr:hypothetical protein JTB14_007259 [Gonioctena quinquepunctata]